MTDFEALATKCEQATVPDRALDWAIHCSEGIEGVGLYGDHPRFTDSLDAALTLVPEGMVFNVGNDARSWAYAWRDTPDYDGMPHSGLAGSPALALCAAALRARGAAHE